MLAPPKAAAKTETYSVSVRNIPVQDLLFALARDAKINVDVHPGINGVVTINAIDQTLQQILTRISKQVDMRWELEGPNLLVMPDSPFLRNYKVDYVNMSRDVTGTVSINTQIASTSTSAGGAAAGGGGNNSSTSVKSTAQNNFWQSLEKNLKDILRESDKILPEGSSETVIERSDQQATTGTGAQNGQSGKSAGSTTSLAGSPNAASLQQQGTTVVKRTTFREASSIIVNPEAGVVVVRATSRQHEKVQEYLDLVLTSARRQVIIEATIAEVRLSDNYQQGINWQSLRSLRPGSPASRFFRRTEPNGRTSTRPLRRGRRLVYLGYRHLCFPAQLCSARTGTVFNAQPAGDFRQGEGAVQPENQRAEQPDRDAQGRRQHRLFRGQKRLDHHHDRNNQ